ncbi:MAG TPA: response regulator transcription factor [Candidatus Acidoferrum sp.]|nr:response regulator transcription factor [Candidatus Acidoferrum sp.]
MIRILIADDQEMFRVGLRTVLATQDGITVVGEARDGREAVARAQRTRPDVVLMDVRMPEMDGIAAIAELRLRGVEVKSLVLTTFDDVELLNAALEAGAVGYILKGTPVEDIADVIRLVHKGYSPFSAGLVQTLAVKTNGSRQSLEQDVARLSPREREIFELLGMGMTNRQIAERLYLSEGTVRNIVSSVLSVLGLRHRTEAALVANHARPRLHLRP